MEEKRPREGRLARNGEAPEEEGFGASIATGTEEDLASFFVLRSVTLEM